MNADVCAICGYKRKEAEIWVILEWRFGVCLACFSGAFRLKDNKSIKNRLLHIIVAIKTSEELEALKKKKE